jgi:hypothetical protein
VRRSLPRKGDFHSPGIGGENPRAGRCAGGQAAPTMPGMPRNTPFAGIVAAAALTLLAGCALGPIGRPAAAATPTPNPAVVYRQFAQCIRTHGLPDFPDPVLDAQGQPQLPPGVDKPPDAIMQACSSVLNQLPASSRGSGAQQPNPAEMRRFAQCLRAHGIEDWPDPNPDGSFTFPPSLAGNLKTSPRWSQIQAAWNGPCKQYNTSGHIRASQ